MNPDLNILIEAGLDTGTGIGYTGGKEKYISAVQRYYKNYEKNRGKIESSLSSADYESYTITVHSLKSNSRMIGASALGDHFEELELASKAGDTDTLQKKTEAVLSEYGNLIEKIRDIGEMDKVTAEGEISGDEARETADKLLDALDNFDDTLSKELVIKLSGYPFRITQKELLKTASDYINEFMYDEAAEKIRAIYDSIE